MLIRWRLPVLTIWLLAGWLLVAQGLGLAHQCASKAHPLTEACVSCALNGTAGAALPGSMQIAAALPPLRVSPVDAVPVHHHFFAIEVRARGPPCFPVV